MPDLDFLEPAPTSEPEPVKVAPEPTSAVEPVAEGVSAAPPAAQDQPRDEQGRFLKRDETPPQQYGHTVPLEALLAEREKRQAAERAAQQLQSAQPKPDFWQDPDAALAVRDQELETRLRAEAETAAEQRARKLFFGYTENAARGRYTDYDQVRAVFAEEAARNPMLATQLHEALDPAEFIYRQGRTAIELREVGGDLGAYRKRLEAKIRAEVEAEVAAKAARNASIPQSLNTEPSKGAGITGAVWNGPTPLEDILPIRRQ